MFSSCINQLVFQKIPGFVFKHNELCVAVPPFLKSDFITPPAVGEAEF